MATLQSLISLTKRSALLLCLLPLFFSCTSELSDDDRDAPDTLRFFALGDWGRDGMSNQKELAIAMDKLASGRKIDFILALGDNFYEDGVDSDTDPQWETSFEKIYSGSMQQIPWYVALGNHDYLGDPTAEINYTKKSRRWKMPSYFYTVVLKMKDGGSLRLVVLDTSPFEYTYYSPSGFSNKFKIDSTRQLQWMDSVFSLKDADWTIASGHHPIYTGGLRVSEPNTVRNSLLPVFNKHNIQAFFAGHEHDIQHLKPADLPTHQFISGAASEIRPTGSTPITKFSASTNGFMSVEVTRKTMDVYVLDLKLDTLYKTQLTK